MRRLTPLDSIFKTPDVNFDADEYLSMINWYSNIIVTEPPVTKDLYDDELENNIKKYLL